MFKVTHICAVTMNVILTFTFGITAVATEPIFENVTQATGLGGGSFVAWADYDDDGHIDLVTGGKLYHNNGDGKFTPIETFEAGGHGVWGDFDNDGNLIFMVWGVKASCCATWATTSSNPCRFQEMYTKCVALLHGVMRTTTA